MNRTTVATAKNAHVALSITISEAGHACDMRRLTLSLSHRLHKRLHVETFDTLPKPPLKVLFFCRRHARSMQVGVRNKYSLLSAFQYITFILGMFMSDRHRTLNSAPCLIAEKVMLDFLLNSGRTGQVEVAVAI